MMNVHPVAPSRTRALMAADATRRDFTGPPEVRRDIPPHSMGKSGARREQGARTLAHIPCGILEVAERTCFYAF
ncbi:protein of unknown function [Microbacterium sp. Nx66]|nr:protein of unknown function [Microbacterium sp. Nx66]